MGGQCIKALRGAKGEVLGCEGRGGTSAFCVVKGGEARVVARVSDHSSLGYGERRCGFNTKHQSVVHKPRVVGCQGREGTSLGGQCIRVLWGVKGEAKGEALGASGDSRSACVRD